MSLQKQKQPETDEPKKKDGSPPAADPKLTEAVSESGDLINRLDKATKRKRGHWEECCGVRVWVED